MQMALLPMGVTEPKLIYNTVAEISKMAGFGSPALFWKLPGPPQPPPDSPEVQREKVRLQFESQRSEKDRIAEQQKFLAESQLEKEKMAFEGMQNEKDRATDLEKTRMSEATKLAVAELEAHTKQDTLNKSHAFEAQKVAATFAQEDKTAQIPERDALMERDSQMSELMGNLQMALSALADSISRPRVAVRDPQTNKPMYGRPMTDEEMAKIGRLQ